MNNNPFAPSQPSQPTQPGQPGPVGYPPTNPTPVAPVAPVQPAQPVTSATPVTPVQPTAPITPTAPTAPTPASGGFGSTPGVAPTGANSNFASKLPLPLPAIIGCATAVVVAIILIAVVAISNTKENKIRSALDSLLAQNSNTIEFDASSTKGNYAKVAGNVRYVTRDGETTTASDIALTYNDGKTDYGTNTLYLVSDNGNETYFKISLSDKLGDLGVTLNGINNQWYKLSKEEVGNLASSIGASLTSSEDNDLSCMGQKLSILQDNKYRGEIVNAIMNNHFLKIGDSQKDSNGTYYEITFDREHVKDTLDALAKTRYVKEVYKCGEKPSFDVERGELKASTSDIGNVTDYIDEHSPRIKVYISGFLGKKLDRAEIAAKNDADVDSLNLKVANRGTLIGIPSSAKSSDDLEKALNDAFSAGHSSSSWLNDDDDDDGDFDNYDYDSDYLRRPLQLQLPQQLQRLLPSSKQGS